MKNEEKEGEVKDGKKKKVDKVDREALKKSMEVKDRQMKNKEKVTKD